MREILFRGQTASGEWVEGDLFINSRNELTLTYIRYPVNDISYSRAKVFPETVGQYTGLTDKNGKKIFEGDIVNFSNILYYIVFADGCFRICRNGQYSYTLHNLHSAFEVIGNIHDNPELLKGRE